LVSGNSNSEEDARKEQPRWVVKYRVTHINDKPYARAKPELLIVKLHVREAKREHIKMLYDSGSTVSLIKLKYLKNDALIYEKKIALTGIIGHKVLLRPSLRILLFRGKFKVWRGQEMNATAALAFSLSLAGHAC